MTALLRMEWEVSTYDFERLYTALPHADLKARLRGLVDQIFDFQSDVLHRDIVAVVIFKMNTKVPVWLTQEDADDWAQPGEQGVFVRDNKRHIYRVFYLQDFTCALTYLIDHTFFRVGDRVFRQIRGIPMGTNCAVFVANFYLFTYTSWSLYASWCAAPTTRRPPKGRR
jgi:hypothetical protein